MFQILVTVILVCQLRRWNSRKPTRSGRHLSTSVGGSNVVKGDGQYPRFLEQHLVLVGYEHTQMGNCSGRACKLNDGREPIKVGSCISACACIRSTVNVIVCFSKILIALIIIIRDVLLRIFAIAPS